jgi:AraC-like DNA-binding protein
MEKEKPYLDPDLSFEQLSKMVSIPPRSLTIVLNECLNQNFYDFINSYRVQESARILMEKNPQYKTVLEVLLEAGFNNKSSFNTAFKKYNGMTPSEFRKLQASHSS